MKAQTRNDSIRYLNERITERDSIMKSLKKAELLDSLVRQDQDNRLLNKLLNDQISDLSNDNRGLSEKINLYDNSLNEAVVELSLRGKPMTVTNQELAPDLSTKGCFPKAWIRRGKDFILLKDGGDDAVQKELLASRLCQCFDFKQVKYDEDFYDGQKVTQSKIITSRQYSIVSKMAFEIYALNHDLNVLNECLRIDKETYYGMNILDYLVGNIDRHPENWGFLVDNRTNEYVSLYPIMDFNQSFGSYDTIDGANCQTVYPEKKTQREAAIEAVRHVGMHQIKDIDEEIFEDRTVWKEMFFRRLEELKNAVDTSVF